MVGGGTLLELRDVTRSFGGLHAVRGVNLQLHEGEIVGLIGPNGAGKTTTLNIASGFDRPTSGTVVYDGMPSPGLGAAQVARRFRFARTFQNIRLFSGMSVLDNVRVGCFMHGRSGLVASILKLPRARAEDRLAAERATEMLDLVGLADKARTDARSLSYGEKRRVEIARALATDPRCLLLDEPAAGFTIKETDQLQALLHGLNERIGIALLVVEHKVRFIMSLSDHVVVLNFGEVIASGPPAEVQNDPLVIDAYLGVANHA